MNDDCGDGGDDDIIDGFGLGVGLSSPLERRSLVCDESGLKSLAMSFSNPVLFCACSSSPLLRLFSSDDADDDADDDDADRNEYWRIRGLAIYVLVVLGRVSGRKEVLGRLVISAEGEIKAATLAHKAMAIYTVSGILKHGWDGLCRIIVSRLAVVWWIASTGNGFWIYHHFVWRRWRKRKHYERVKEGRKGRQNRTKERRKPQDE